MTYGLVNMKSLIDMRHDPVIISRLCAGGQVGGRLGWLVHQTVQGVGVVDALGATHIVPVCWIHVSTCPLLHQQDQNKVTTHHNFRTVRFSAVHVVELAMRALATSRAYEA